VLLLLNHNLLFPAVFIKTLLITAFCWPTGLVGFTFSPEDQNRTCCGSVNRLSETADSDEIQESCGTDRDTEVLDSALAVSKSTATPPKSCCANRNAACCCSRQPVESTAATDLPVPTATKSSKSDCSCGNCGDTNGNSHGCTCGCRVASQPPPVTSESRRGVDDPVRVIHGSVPSDCVRSRGTQSKSAFKPLSFSNTALHYGVRFQATLCCWLI
jgi:hypothetical protein